MGRKSSDERYLAMAARVRVIHAEDEPSSRALISRLLAKAGYEVQALANGREALNAICAARTGIIVADWMMPELDGLELCRAVRAAGREGRVGFVYFILLTAHRDKEHIVAGLEAGADDYLTKPFHPKELLARIRAGERIWWLQNELVKRQEQLTRANRELCALNQKLERLASTDVLTGVPNRRSLFERFEEAWSMSCRSKQPLGCIMLDIDHFKCVNDTYGHHVGDEVLQHIAAVCRATLRRHDVLGRFGGEEFCVVCQQTPPSGVAQLAERIRASVDARPFCRLDERIPITVSVGAAMRMPEHANPEALIVVADDMLYHAKQHGRNQAWMATPTGPRCLTETAAATQRAGQSDAR